jgi:hypothetical protein
VAQEVLFLSKTAWECNLAQKLLRSVESAAVCGMVCIFIVQSFGQTSSQSVSRSPHGRLSIPCQNCHTSVGWKPIRAVPEFDHDNTRYPLRGQHREVGCTQCHAKPVFTNVGSHCADCHADIHMRQMGAKCEECHTVKGWSLILQTVREHDNRFPLVGGTVPGLVDSVLLMPPDHLSADNCPEPHGRSIGVCCPVRAVSFHQQLVGRQI